MTLACTLFALPAACNDVSMQHQGGRHNLYPETPFHYQKGVDMTTSVYLSMGEWVASREHFSEYIHRSFFMLTGNSVLTLNLCLAGIIFSDSLKFGLEYGGFLRKWLFWWFSWKHSYEFPHILAKNVMTLNLCLAGLVVFALHDLWLQSQYISMKKGLHME